MASGVIDDLFDAHPAGRRKQAPAFEEAASAQVALETPLPAAMRLVHAGAIDLPDVARPVAEPCAALGLGSGRMSVDAPADLVCSTRCAFVLDRWTLTQIKEHALRRPAHARQGTAHLCRRRAGLHGDWAGHNLHPRSRGGCCSGLFAGLGSFRHRDGAALGLGNLREIGSGNIGATNALRTGNKLAAFLTLILDAGKGGIAVIAARVLVGKRPR